MGAVNCLVTARWEPTGPVPPGAHLDFRRARPGGVGQRGAVGRVVGCAVSGRAWAGEGVSVSLLNSSWERLAGWTGLAEGEEGGNAERKIPEEAGLEGC